jgi:mRNA interferase MazF
VRRGEIWWAELAPPAGRRPVLLLSRNEAYAVRELVMVAPLTTRIRGIPSEVSLGDEDGVPHACVVNLDSITTIAKTGLRERLTALSAEKLKAVETALHFSLGLEW